MRFGRLLAAVILLGVLFSPANHLARTLGRAPISGDGIFNSVLSGLIYLTLLLAFHFLVTAALYLTRRLLVFTDAWQGLGMADLDVGVHGLWPYQWLGFAGLIVLIGAMFGSSAHWTSSVVEALAASVAVLFALMGGPPRANPIDDYDPLPVPVPYPPGPTPEPAPTPPPPFPADLIPLKMSWYFRLEPGALGEPATNYEVSVNASKSRYEALMAKDHGVKTAGDYGRFVRDGLTPEVEETVRQLRQISERDGLTTISEINNVLALAQRFRYALDSEDKGVAEYPKYPLETMVEDRGDCEDHAIVAAACLVRLGYEVRLVSIEYDSGPGHMALAVAGAEELPDAFSLRDPISGRNFYYCDATTDAGSRDPNAVAFRMGEVPEPDRQAKMELVSVG